MCRCLAEVGRDLPPTQSTIFNAARASSKDSDASDMPHSLLATYRPGPSAKLDALQSIRNYCQASQVCRQGTRLHTTAPYPPTVKPGA